MLRFYTKKHARVWNIQCTYKDNIYNTISRIIINIQHAHILHEGNAHADPLFRKYIHVTQFIDRKYATTHVLHGDSRMYV